MIEKKTSKENRLSTLNKVINIYRNKQYKSPPTTKEFLLECKKEGINFNVVKYYFFKLNRSGLIFKQEEVAQKRLDYLLNIISEQKKTLTTGELFNNDKVKKEYKYIKKLQRDLKKLNKKKLIIATKKNIPTGGITSEIIINRGK